MNSQEGAQAKRAPGGLVGRPLNLIHRNNCSNSMPMRVPGRFARVLLTPVRAVLYAPVSVIGYLPGGPLRWLWIVRLVVALDAPLRRVILGRALHARTV